MRLAEHVTRTEEARNVYLVMVGGERPRVKTKPKLGVNKCVCVCVECCKIKQGA